MPVFVSSETAPNTHGVFAIERNPPATVQATGTGTACIIEQFPWGPVQTVTEPTSIGDMLNMVAPPGMSRTGSGYLSVIKKGWPLLKFIRVLGASSVAATASLPDAVPTNIVKVDLKYTGVAGNSVTWTVAAASDGDNNHFNLTVTVTGTSGTTTDIVRNLNYSGTGTDSAPDLSSALLIGAITKLASGRPINGSGSFGTGADGTAVDATDYVGTQGAGDKGAALLEGDDTIDFMFAGDPGNTLRTTVNSGLVAHADYMTDRVAVINGNSGQTASGAKTDVASYRSTRAVYVDPWVYINDDVDGTKRLVPSAAFLASVACQLSPSTPVSWKDSKVRVMLNGIVDLEANRGQSAGTNTDSGIVTVIKEKKGGFSFESQVVTEAPVTPSKKRLTRTRMGHYIARSYTDSVRGLVDAPNVQLNQQDLVDALDVFMGGLKKNASTDPNNKPHVVDYSIPNLAAFNVQSNIDAGQYTVPLDAKLSSGMEKIFLSIQYGETVTVTAT